MAKGKKRVSYTPKSVKYLKDNGWLIVENVEHWNSFARIMKDLIGFVDVWAYHPERGHLFVQSTSKSNTSTRIKKIIEEHGVQARWLVEVRYNKIVVHGWYKEKNRWQLKEIDITEKILDEVPRSVGYGMENERSN